MQFQRQGQEELGLHEMVTKTVSDMYAGIDSIIESAKNYVKTGATDAEQLVNYIDAYVKYMHKVVDNIVITYTALFVEDDELQEEEPQYRNPTDEEMETFQHTFESCIEYARTATEKVHKKLSSTAQ